LTGQLDYSLQIYTVSQLTEHISGLFETDATLQDVWLQGEISNSKLASSGHFYFTLKDQTAQMGCVMWRNQVSKLARVPEDGEEAIAHGRAAIYAAQGRYQLYVDWMRLVGEGELFLQREQLVAKLEGEGLFAQERKRQLPAFPRRIGVVTSPVGAAVHDILHILEQRYPVAQIIIAPTLVQGEEAPPQIAAAIDTLGSLADVDVIIVARGGGSAEELWAFNDERVARAVFASRVPVVSGVGHETDWTICDLVADVRAPTPTAAAQLAVPDQQVLRATIVQWQEAVQQAWERALSDRRLQVEQAEELLHRLSPRATLDRRRQDLDGLSQRMQMLQRHRLALRGQGLAGMTSRLHALSPQGVLDRGYALVSRRDNGLVVAHRAEATPGDAIDIRVSDGSFGATVE